MELINESVFPAAWMVGKIQPQQWSMTCLVKGTFQLRQGDVAVLAEEQAPLTGDTHVENDINKLLRYSSDFAYFKPNADLILMGTCYVPNSGASSALPVRLRVGAYEKVLMVVGDRMMDDRGNRTEPKPFQKMPLTYQYAYGGSGYANNPLGKGHAPVVRDGLSMYYLPNIVYSQSASDTRTHVDPAGFGPISQTLPQRIGKMGTFDDVWLNQRWPWFPDDFNMAFFNAAPDDQQLHGYLRGDEDLYFENLHPVLAHYRCRLPGLRIRCFLEERVRAHINFREVSMQLDTLWIDMDAEQLILVWRGVAPIRTEKLEEILYYFVVAETMDQLSRPLIDYDAALVAALKKREEEDRELEEEYDDDDEDDDEEKKRSETEEDDLGEEESTLASLEENQLPAIVPNVIRQPVILEQPASKQPSPIESPDSEQMRKQPLDPEDELADQLEEEPVEEDDDVLTTEQLMGRIRRKESLEDAELSNLDLSGVDLSRLNMRNAVFDRVILYNANLSCADLTGAMLAGLNLQDANCQSATFSGADLSEARLCGTDFSRAILQDTDFIKADLRNSNLKQVNAKDADFSGADLSDATLVGANLTSADLSDCKLHRSNLAHTNLTEASLERAWGRHIQLEEATVDILKAAGANFCEGNFKRINGKETVWEEGEYYGADFSGASLPAAEFSSSYLGWAKFNAADLTNSAFDEACLVSAEMVRTKLLNASIQKADLAQANLQESNLYEANICFSNLAGTKLEKANLRMLKHTMENSKKV